MSAVPFATSGECDTMTIPTFLPIYDSDSALQVRFQKTAYCGYDQFRRTGTRIHVPLAALAQVGGPAASGNHGYRFLRGRARALAHITQGTSPVCSAQLLERGHQHVEHGLVPHVGAPERLDRTSHPTPSARRPGSFRQHRSTAAGASPGERGGPAATARPAAPV